MTVNEKRRAAKERLAQREAAGEIRYSADRTQYVERQSDGTFPEFSSRKCPRKKRLRRGN